MKTKYLGIILLVLLFALQPQMTESLISVDSTTTFRGSELSEPIISKSIGLGGEEHLIANVVPNSGMEYYESYDGRPRYLSSSGDGYEVADSAYMGDPWLGSYSGRLLALGTDQFYAQANLDRSANNPLLTESLDLDLWYNCKSNPDLQNNQEHYMRLRLRDTSLSQNIYFYYYFSHNGRSDINNTVTGYAYFDLNTTIDSWTHLQRNVTYDFDQVYGFVNPNVVFQDIDFYAQSSNFPAGYSELLVDEVSLTNSTAYDYFWDNGDFEDGDSSNWSETLGGPSYVVATDERVSGYKALNLTATSAVTGGYGDAGVSSSFSDWDSPPAGLYVTGPGTIVADFDWKYQDGTGTYEFAYFYINGYNSTLNFNIYVWLGHVLDTMPWSNYSTSSYKDIHITSPNFGNRGIWNHDTIDLYDLLPAFGLVDIPITYFGFSISAGYNADSKVELLLDNFEVQAYPTGDPYFEQDFYWSASNPIVGWTEDAPVNYVNITSDSHSGNWAANVSSYNGYGRADIYRDTQYLEIQESYYTDFWWKIDEHILGTSYTASVIELDFDGGFEIIYILGASSDYSEMNDSNSVYYYVDNFNVTGVWNNLARNIVDDLNAVFTPMNWYLNQITMISYSYGTGGAITTIFDDIHFIQDTHGPELIMYIHSNDPTYYQDALFNIFATDQLTNVDNIIVEYRTDSTWIPENALYIGPYYDAWILTGWMFQARIPQFDYGTTVNMRFVMEDARGLITIDDNSGTYYSYDIIDDVNPLVEILQITTDSEYGLATIDLNCADEGSGIESVVIQDNGVEIAVLDAEPFSYNWDPNVKQESGTHTITVIAADYAGNTATEEFTVEVSVHQEPGAFRSFFHGWGTLIGAGIVGAAWATVTIIQLFRKPK